MSDEKQKLATIRTALESRIGQLKTLLPRHLTPDRMIRMALIGIIRQPRLLECTTVSVVKGVMDASALGLDCSGLLGNGYLVPYKNKRGEYEAQFIPGYRGLAELARRGGKVRDITAHVVYTGDRFKCAYGSNPVLEHEPDWNGKREDALIIAAYAVAFLSNDIHHSEVMTRAEIDAIRKRSKARDDGPWVTDFAEMARKTVVRKLVKYLPMSVDLEHALVVEAEAESDTPIDVDFELPKETNGVDKVKEMLLQKSAKDIATEQSEPYAEKADD